MSFDENSSHIVSVFCLTENSVFMSDKSELNTIEVGSADWLALRSGHNEASDRIFSVYAVQTDQDVHSLQWEMHPAGDEMIGVISGHLSLILEDASGSQRMHLTAMTGAIVPAGTWHRFKVITPAQIFTVTRGEGTQLRDVADE